MKLQLDYARALTLIMHEYNQLQIVLVGCGGTGSWLAPAVARIARMLSEQGRKIELTFCDPDKVEEKNIYRQNFCAAEIGKNKADALAERYGMAWGVEIKSLPGKYKISISTDTIVIGCVDNAAARRSIHNSFAGYDYYWSWWLDCGNTKNYGQVLLGGGGKIGCALEIPGRCGWLPLPGTIHPELLKTELAETEDDKLSCAEMALQDSQGMAINQRMAAEAADYLVRMLITKDLKKYATYIDLESGSCQSKYINSGLVNEFGGKEKKKSRPGCMYAVPGRFEDDENAGEDEDEG